MCFFFFGALHSSMRHTPSSGLRGGQDGDRCPIEGGDGWAAGWLPMRLVWWSVLHDSIAGWPVVFSSQFSMPIPQRCGDTDMVAIFRHMGRISPFNLNCRRPLFTPCGLLLQSLQNKDFLGRLLAVRSVGSHAGLLCFFLFRGSCPFRYQPLLSFLVELANDDRSPPSHKDHSIRRQPRHVRTNSRGLVRLTS